MKLSFDKFERYELPQVTLCNPNSRAIEVGGKITITDTVGVLSNPKGMNLKLNFNAPHELSFDYYRHKSSDPIKQSFYDSIYEAIQTDRYIYLTDIGYFIISSVTDSDEDNIDKKSISLKSCEENELATAEGLHLKEGTYYLHTDNNDGLIDLFLPKTAGWTIGFIDPSLLTKPYFVEDTEVDNGYNFLYTTVQDMFECIVEPDIIKRNISVYSRVYYAEHHLTDIHIAKYNLLKHKTVEENDEDKYTALNVQGKDENLEIRTVNPTGKNIIYNFEPRHSMMSPALQLAVVKWQEKCESVEDEYLTLQQGYYNDMQNIVFPLEEDIKVLEVQLKEKEQTRDTIVYGDYDKEKYGEVQQDALDAVNVEITTITGSITDKKETLEVERNKIQTNYSERIDQINLECALETTDIFTTELRNELMTHIKPTDYVDEYMLVTESMTYPQRFEKAKELMDRAQSQLIKISSGQKTYSIDTRSFLFNKQFKHFSEQLCAGVIIYVETKKDSMEQLHLTGIDISFDDKSTNFTLGNKYDRSDLKALYDDALGQNSKSFSELKYIASIVEDQQKYYKRDWAAELRTLTLNNILVSEDQAIEINNRGLIGRKRQLNEDGSWKNDKNGNPLFDPEQVKLINNTLIFTDNNWQNATTAVGKIAVGYNGDGSVKYSYGINGQVIIGELFLGNNLVLTGTSAGIKIKDSQGYDAFFADNEGNLVLQGNIQARTGYIGGWKIDYNVTDASGNYNGYYLSYNNDQMYICPQGRKTGNIAVYINGNFVVDTEGGVTAKTGNVGGWSINSTGLFSGNNWSNAPIGMSANSTSAFWAGYSNGIYKFRVTNDGLLYATEGNIAGWALCNTYFGQTQEYLHSNGNKYTYGAGLYADGAGTDNVCLAIGYMPQGIEGSWNNAEFRVTGAGKLYATGADISGKIAASEGSIGGWNILESRLEKDRTSDSGYRCGIQNISGDNSSVFYAGCSTAAGGNIVGKSKFYVTQAGDLYANSIHVSTVEGTDGKHGDSYLSVQESSNDGSGAYEMVRWVDVVVCTQDWLASWSSESDKNVKNSISSLDAQYELLFDNLKPCCYKYNHGTSDRFHTGFIAQDVVDSIEKAGLTTQDFAGVVHLETPNHNGCEWLLRRDEFVSLNTWQIQKAKARITELENTVAELKTQIQTLTAG